MTLNVRKGSQITQGAALIKEVNRQREREVGVPITSPDATDLASAILLVNEIKDEINNQDFHGDTTSLDIDARDPNNPTAAALQVTAADSDATLPVAITLVNQLQAVINLHFADDLSHDTAVSAQDATPVAVDLATAQTLATALKAAFNTHLTEANVHFVDDATNTVTSADATNQATLDTLIDEMKADVNAHITGASAGDFITQSNA